MNSNLLLDKSRLINKSILNQFDVENKNDLVNCIFDDYIIIELLETNSLYKCVKKTTMEPFICKILLTKDCHNYLISYARLKDSSRINKIENILVGSKYTMIILSWYYEDLHSYVRNKKRLKENEACVLFHQITSIVAYCHQKGVILRDLKLRKFVFKDVKRTQLMLETLDDCLVLSDPSNDQLSKRSKGCPAYVSPEVLSPSQVSYSGKPADCWSLGVILFTMLVGHYPFYGDDPSLIFAKIKEGTFQIPIHTSSLAEFHIRNLLRKDPAERITVEDLLASKWFDSVNLYLKDSHYQSNELNDQIEYSTNERVKHENANYKFILDQTVPDHFLPSNTSNTF